MEISLDPVMVTGASGVLGWHLCRYLAEERLPVVGTFVTHRPAIPGASFLAMDLARPQEILAGIRSHAFRAVVHTAAMTDVEECKKHPEEARRINVDATRELLDRTPEHVPFIYISTDLVFDGQKGPYREEDAANPRTLYGETKLEAEAMVREHPAGVVLRLAKLYANGSPYRPCFVTWMDQRLSAGQKVPLFEDQFRSLLYVGDAVRGILKAVVCPCSHSLFHLGGGQRCSRYDFGVSYCRVFGFDTNLLERVSSADADLLFRGSDCSLDSSRFNREFDFQPVPLDEGLRRLKADRI